MTRRADTNTVLDAVRRWHEHAKREDAPPPPPGAPFSMRTPAADMWLALFLEVDEAIAQAHLAGCRMERAEIASRLEPALAAQIRAEGAARERDRGHDE